MGYTRRANCSMHPNRTGPMMTTDPTLEQAPAPPPARGPGRPRKTPRKDTDAALRMRALQARLGLTPTQAAAYLGVPLVTWRHWHDGLRQPGAAVERLLDVLGIVEALAPDIHERLLPEKRS